MPANVVASFVAGFEELSISDIVSVDVRVAWIIRVVDSLHVSIAAEFCLSNFDQLVELPVKVPILKCRVDFIEFCIAVRGAPQTIVSF
jgi:hypothetical protein